MSHSCLEREKKLNLHWRFHHHTRMHTLTSIDFKIKKKWLKDPWEIPKLISRICVTIQPEINDNFLCTQRDRFTR